MGVHDFVVGFAVKYVASLLVTKLRLSFGFLLFELFLQAFVSSDRFPTVDHVPRRCETA